MTNFNTPQKSETMVQPAPQPDMGASLETPLAGEAMPSSNLDTTPSQGVEQSRETPANNESPFRTVDAQSATTASEILAQTNKFTPDTLQKEIATIDENIGATTEDITEIQEDMNLKAELSRLEEQATLLGDEVALEEIEASVATLDEKGKQELVEMARTSRDTSETQTYKLLMYSKMNAVPQDIVIITITETFQKSISQEILRMLLRILDARALERLAQSNTVIREGFKQLYTEIQSEGSESMYAQLAEKMPDDITGANESEAQGTDKAPEEPSSSSPDRAPQPEYYGETATSVGDTQPTSPDRAPQPHLYGSSATR